jgi:hypothetical protein
VGVAAAHADRSSPTMDKEIKPSFDAGFARGRRI